MRQLPVTYSVVWVETKGDKDKKTSLRELGKSDFFTKELDEMLLAKTIDCAIHSAKDLPDPMPEGLIVVALTKGLDSRDSLVFKELKPGATVATSSERREELVRTWRPDLQFVDLRGTIGERLAKMEQGEVDGVVIAECALIRLGLTHLNRVFFPGPEMQGRLAIVARGDNTLVRQLFGSYTLA